MANWCLPLHCERSAIRPTIGFSTNTWVIHTESSTSKILPRRLASQLQLQSEILFIFYSEDSIRSRLQTIDWKGIAMSTYFVGPLLTQNTVFQLKRLIHLNLACRDEFRGALNHTNDPRAQAAFGKTAEEHGRHAAALQKLLWSQLEETQYQCSSYCESTAHLYGNAGRTQPHGLSAMLSKSEHLENRLQRQYLQALASIKGRAVRQLLTEQSASVQAAGVRMLELRDLVWDEFSNESDCQEAV